MSSDGTPGRMMPVTNEEFRRACGRFATGVTIATVLDAKGTPHGLTVSSFASVSLEPPLILICLGHEVAAIKHFRAGRYFAVNVLTEAQRPLSDRFARKGHDRFDGLAWQPGESGAPLLPNALATMECAASQRTLAGDHDIFVGQVVHVRVADGAPLIHFASAYRKLEST